MKFPMAICGTLLLMLFIDAAGQVNAVVFRSIRLERTACLGSCPVYNVTVEADGTVRYVGDEYVSHLGAQESKIMPDAVARLQIELKNANFFSLRSQRKGRWGCLRPRTDHPSIIIRAVTSKEDRTVTFYTGCSETKNSAALIKLAKAIDEVANTSKWID